MRASICWSDDVYQRCNIAEENIINLAGSGIEVKVFRSFAVIVR